MRSIGKRDGTSAAVKNGGFWLFDIRASIAPRAKSVGRGMRPVIPARRVNS